MLTEQYTQMILKSIDVHVSDKNLTAIIQAYELAKDKGAKLTVDEITALKYNLQEK